MSGSARFAAAALLVLGLAAAAAERIAGPATPPTIAPTAAQLLAPGTLVQELALRPGGFARAPSIEVDDRRVRILVQDRWREASGVRPAGVIRERRMWLGTDQAGRSLLARTLHGARTSLSVALLATVLAMTLGLGLGLWTALAPRFVTALLEVLSDALLGIPRLLLLLILGVALRGAWGGIALAIGLASWMEPARLAQAETRALLARPFAQAAQAGGAGRAGLGLRHVLPNLGPLIVASAPLIATEAVLLESTLAFLGIAGGQGVSWGTIIADAQRLLPGGWWILVFPGALLCATAFALHELVGGSRSGTQRSPRRQPA